MAAPDQFKNQDPRVLSVFEVVGASVCDVVFNSLHHSAKTGLAGGASLTDEYVRRLQAYVVGVKSDRVCYSEVVQGIHSYFTHLTRYSVLSFGEFVDKVVGVCVPDEYFSQFSAEDKDEILSSIVCDLVSNLASFASSPPMLRRIIDGHSVAPDVTVRMLQDAAVNSLLTKRAALRNQFLRNLAQARDHVPMDVVEGMKRALRRLLKEKSELSSRAEAAEADLADSEARLAAAKARLAAGSVREAKLRKLVGLLREGRDHGPLAAGSRLLVPASDTLAEPPPDDGRPRPVPRRERIAEPRREDEASSSHDEEEKHSGGAAEGRGGSSDDDSDGDGSSDGDGDGDDGGDRRAGLSLAPAPPTARPLPRSAPPTARGAPPAARPPGPRPLAFTSILDASVDSPEDPSDFMM